MNNEQPENKTIDTAVVENKQTEKTAKQPAPELAPASELTSWPGAFGIYKYSKKAVMLNVGAILTIILLGFIWNILYSIKLQNIGLQLVRDVLNTLVSILLTTIYTIIWLSGVNNEKVSLSDAFDASKKYIWNVFLASILVGLATIGSLLLFIIPFFFVFPRLIFTSYLVIDKDMKPTEAFKTSWSMSKGHLGKIYGIAGANIAMALLAVTIIGIPFAIYFVFMYTAASAVLYTFLKKQQPATVPASSAQTTESPEQAPASADTQPKSSTPTPPTAPTV